MLALERMGMSGSTWKGDFSRALSPRSSGLTRAAGSPEKKGKKAAPQAPLRCKRDVVPKDMRAEKLVIQRRYSVKADIQMIWDAAVPV